MFSPLKTKQQQNDAPNDKLCSVMNEEGAVEFKMTCCTYLQVMK